MFGTAWAYAAMLARLRARTGLQVGREWHYRRDDVGFVLWTSGTTGQPKPILHTHTAYLELLDRVLAPLRGSDA